MVLTGGKVSIVGGTGRMGQWFASFFKEKGFEVFISGRSLSKTRRVAERLGVNFAVPHEEAVKNADMVLVATPIPETPNIVLKLAKHLKPNSVLFDIASIKQNIIQALEKLQGYGVHALSLHPMFGPGAKTIKGKNLLVIPVTKTPRIVNEVISFFRDAGANVMLVENYEEHDRMMAFTLALPHFINMVFVRTLSSMNIDELKKFGGTTFTLQLLVSESVLQEDPESYASIQIENKTFPSLLEKLMDCVTELRSLVTNKNMDEFTRFFMETRNYVASDTGFKDAYKKFYLALESALSEK